MNEQMNASNINKWHKWYSIALEQIKRISELDFVLIKKTCKFECFHEQWINESLEKI